MLCINAVLLKNSCYIRSFTEIRFVIYAVLPKYVIYAVLPKYAFFLCSFPEIRIAFMQFYRNALSFYAILLKFTLYLRSFTEIRFVIYAVLLKYDLYLCSFIDILFVFTHFDWNMFCICVVFLKCALLFTQFY